MVRLQPPGFGPALWAKHPLEPEIGEKPQRYPNAVRDSNPAAPVQPEPLPVFAADGRPCMLSSAPLEIVSEASRRLPPEIKSQHPEIDWAAVAAAGNVYRHEYDAVDEKLIWHTVRHDLSALRAVAAPSWNICAPRRDRESDPSLPASAIR